MAKPLTALPTVLGRTWLQRHIRTSAKQHPRIKGEDKLQFFQQLTTLFAAGTPLLEALRITSVQSQSQKMQTVIRTIADRVAGGVSLHQAAADFPKVFGRISFFVNAGIRFIEEQAKIRAMGSLWEQLGRERYGVSEEKL
ncbi:hypothetical protein LCGC14_2516210, partial [marine sediment metagenome]